MLNSARYRIIYLTTAAPILFLLCFLTAPFQVPDEFAHYFRAIQLSHGEVGIVVAPDGKSAGAYIDQTAIETAGLFDNYFVRYSPDYRMDLAQLGAAASVPQTAVVEYKNFSNTVIYFPVVHLAAAAGVAIARIADMPAMGWLYLGRLSNVALALTISTVALSLFEAKSLYGLVVCLLPTTLFEEASLSGDAIVIPAGLLLAGLTFRLSRHETSVGDQILLFVTLLVCAVGKFAYMPLIFLPPLVAFSEGRSTRSVLRLSLVSIVVLGIWVAWTLYTRRYVFSMREGVAENSINLQAQVDFILTNPLQFAKILTSSIVLNLKSMAATAMGSRLSWGYARASPVILVLAASFVFVSSMVSSAETVLRWKSRALIIGAVASCYILVYVLVYLQFDPVGQTFIDGVQGRYILPLLGFLPFLVPPIVVPRVSNRIRSMTAAGSVIVAIGTLAYVGTTFWS